MAKKDEVEFLFNPNPFIAAFQKAGNAMDKFKANAISGSKDIGKSFTWAVAKGQLLANGIMAFGKAAIQTIGQQIPEIGQAFGIAKEIIFKNLFWPLRQQIVPLLQKMLDWVRDNRVQFVKMGQVIVGLFKTAWTVAKTFLDVLAPLWESLKQVLGFGKGDWMNTVNVILAKVAVVAMYIAQLVKPIFGFVTDIVDALGQSGLLKSLGELALVLIKVPFDAITGFFAGFSQASAGMWGNLKGIVDLFSELFSAWSTSNRDGASIMTFFQTLGNALGILMTFVTGLGKELLTGLVSNLRNVMTPLTSIGESIGKIFSAVAGDGDFLGTLFRGLGAGLGMVIDIGLNSLALLMEMLVAAISTMGTFGDILGDIFTGRFDRIPAKISKIGADWAKTAPKFQALFNSVVSGAGNTWQAFTGTPTTAPQAQGSRPGQAIRDGVVQNGRAVSTDPKDVIVAHKGQVSVNRGGGAMQMGPVSISVTVTEGNARQAGINFAEGLQYQLRSQLAAESMTGGR